MVRLLLYTFILIPIIEIVVFILLGDFFTLWQLISIIITTAFIGITIIKKKGLQTFYKAQEQLRSNNMPIAEIYDGTFLIISATLLLIPGFVTDLFGFLLFFRGVRNLFKAVIFKSLVANINLDGYMKNNNINTANTYDKTIDGEFEEVRAPNISNSNKTLK